MGVTSDFELPTGTPTLLFTDIEGSTRLLRSLGERYGQTLKDHHRLLRSVWSAHGGVEVDTEGDAFFVGFAQASAAVAAATAAQGVLAAYGWPDGHSVRVRMGIHTGEARQRDGKYWGIDVHYAARLCAAAHGGQVLLSAATRALVPDVVVDDLGPQAFKDFEVPRNVFHLVIAGVHSSAYPPPRTVGVARSNLPSQAGSLIGRESEVAEVVGRFGIGSERLVTLTGPGGVGKTRLAVACAQRLATDFEDGAFLASLAPVTDPEEVGPAISEAVGVPRGSATNAEGDLVEYLRRRKVLLVLDNLEQLPTAGLLISRILEAAPDVRVLATSQAPLRLSAENVVPVAPLAVPDSESVVVDQALQAGAICLFVERARATDPTFTLTDLNVRPIAELCQQLDGLPLAIELAAARIRLAGVDGLLKALQRGGDALGRGSRDLPNRQRGLRAALEWTVSLLDDDERHLFVGFGVFADAWTLEQAERVFGSDLDTWEATATLLDFSLIKTRGDGRLTMAERIRRHARESFAASDRATVVRRAHAELMAETFEVINGELFLDFTATMADIREQLRDLELALDWSRSHDRAVYRRLIAAGGRPLYLLARLGPLADEIIALVEHDEATDAISGRLLIVRGMVELANNREVTKWTEAAVQCHRTHGSSNELLTSIIGHAHLLALTGRGAEARASVAEGLALAAGNQDQRIVDQLEGTLAIAALGEGKLEEAELRLAQILAAPERTDFAAGTAMSSWAACARMNGDYQSALERYLLSLGQKERNYDVINSVGLMLNVARCLAHVGHDPQAAELIGSIDRIAHGLGIATGIISNDYEEVRAMVEPRLTQPEWARHHAIGRQRDFEQAREWTNTQAPRLSLSPTTTAAPSS